MSYHHKLKAKHRLWSGAGQPTWMCFFAQPWLPAPKSSPRCCTTIW